MAINLDFLDWSLYIFFQVAPQLSWSPQHQVAGEGDSLDIEGSCEYTESVVMDS
jgi:hypothetical protein